MNQVWARAYKDCRLLKKTRIAITQAGIGQLLTLGMAAGIEKTGVLYEDGGVAIVPADQTKVRLSFRRDQHAKRARSVPMKQWKSVGKEDCCKILQESNASEETISERTPLTLGQLCN